MTRYGLLDESGEVIRWVWQCPPAGVPYTTQDMPVTRPEAIDWNNFEEAPF